MARSIKRNVLRAKVGEVADMGEKQEGRSWRRPYESEESWLEKGKRWSGTSQAGSESSGSYRAEAEPEYRERVTAKTIATGMAEKLGVIDIASRLRRGEGIAERAGELRGKDIGKSALIGLLGGLAATFLMTQVQTARQKAQQRNQTQKPESDQAQQVDEQSTVKAAQRLAHVAKAEIPPQKRQTAGNAVHYAFGTTMGGVYGTLAGLLGDAPFGTGVLFGIGLWLAADEFLLPYLGLSAPPQQRDAKEHVYDASVHAVYGLCLDGVNLLRKRVA
jgi:putative membrane protein